jgi:hypothetical protein
MLSAWSRRISARRQFGAASNDAISTWPAMRSPPSINVATTLASDAIIGVRGLPSGSVIIT